MAGFLLAIALTSDRPPRSASFKADEPNYLMMALSLWHDHDLVCEQRDLDRLFVDFRPPAGAVALMTDDGGRTVHFSLPWLYPLVAAPFAGLLGARGLTVLNIGLLLASIAMAAAYLRRRNEPVPALLFAAGFFIWSPIMAYTFWLHPEVFVAGATTAAFAASARSSRLATIGSAIALAIAVYHKPMLAPFGLPLLVDAARTGGHRRVLLWLVAAATAFATAGGGSVALTGSFWPYVGTTRGTHRIVDPPRMPDLRAAGGTTARPERDWGVVLRPPIVTSDRLHEDAPAFLWGRHVGLVPYLPWAVLSVIAVAVDRRRRARSASILIALTAVAYLFMASAPRYWQGGGGFIGNRYFITAYPAFIFLVGAIRPWWLSAVAWAAGALLVGPLALAPWWHTHTPELQAHTRGHTLRRFPVEPSIMRLLSDYHGITHGDTWLWGHRDDLAFDRGEVWLRGDSTAELYLRRAEPITTAVFLVRSTTGGPIQLSLGDVSASVTSDTTTGWRRVDLAAPTPWHVRRLTDDGGFFYRLVVGSPGGALRRAHNGRRFWAGTRLVYVGDQAELAAREHRASWATWAGPRTLAAGISVSIMTELTNLGRTPWSADGPLRVTASYRWIAPDGAVVAAEGRRTRLPVDVAPGASVAIEQVLDTPCEPGLYTLERDLVHENLAWFADADGGEAQRVSVTITAVSDRAAGRRCSTIPAPGR